MSVAGSEEGQSKDCEWRPPYVVITVMISHPGGLRLRYLLPGYLITSFLLEEQFLGFLCSLEMVRDGGAGPQPSSLRRGPRPPPVAEQQLF